MKLDREFIRNTILSIKKEKDKIKLDLNMKFDLLSSIINTISVNIESALRYNFPTVQIPPLNFNTQLITNTDFSYESSAILNGSHEVITTFMRHIEFLKLTIDNPCVRENLDKQLNYYFNYWDEDFYNNEYVLTEYERENHGGVKHDILNSLDQLYSVLGYKAKEQLNITNSDKDNWDTNAPVKYSFDKNNGLFNLELDNGLECVVNSYIIKHCPQIAENINSCIIREYKEHFGFDYLDFPIIMNKFIDFICELLKEFLIRRHEDCMNIKGPYSYSASADIVYDHDFKVSKQEYKSYIHFIFESLYDGNTQQKKIIEINIDNPNSNKDNITVKLPGTYQYMIFEFNRDDSENPITFCGFTKNNNDKITYLSYITTNLELAILYFGSKILEQKLQYFNRLNINISAKLKETLDRETSVSV